VLTELVVRQFGRQNLHAFRNFDTTKPKTLQAVRAPEEPRARRPDLPAGVLLPDHASGKANQIERPVVVAAQVC